MTTESIIRKNVLKRVHRVHMLRPLTSTLTASTFVFFIAVWGISREVWVARVLENMPSLADATAFYQFFFTAFLHTDVMVQTLSLLALAAFLWLVHDGLRNLLPTPRFA